MRDKKAKAVKEKVRRPGVSALSLNIRTDLKEGLDRLAVKEGRTLRTIVERALQRIIK